MIHNGTLATENFTLYFLLTMADLCTKQMGKPFINRENAARLAALSAAARRAKRDAALCKPAPPAPVAVVAQVAENLADNKDDYAVRRLLRVRGQLDRLDDRMDYTLAARVLDAQKVERLARASCQLSESERILAGRPLPGSIKPKSAGNGSRRPMAEPSTD